METKRCPRCKNDLDTDLFYKSKSRSDGLSSHCKECSREIVRIYEQTPAGKESKSKKNKKYKQYHTSNNTAIYAKSILQRKTGMSYKDMDDKLIMAQQANVELYRTLKQ